MSAVFQIAWREYKQYVFSRGFLLFLIMFPLGFLFAGGVFSFAERAKPVRHFVVIDQAGGFSQAIDREIANRTARRTLANWEAYLKLSVDGEFLEEDFLKPPFASGPITTARAIEFQAAGGSKAANAAVADYVKPGMVPFTESRQVLVRVPAPPELDDIKSLEEASDLLRPYLLGDKKITTQQNQMAADGAKEVELFAALLIPENYGVGGEEASDQNAQALEAQFWSRNITDDTLRSAVGRALDVTLRRKKIAQLGLAASSFDEIVDTEAQMGVFRPDREDEDAAFGVKDSVEIILPGVMTYMLVFIVMGIGNLLLTNTIEERSNKIVEILLSSVTADQLMRGKLIGIGAVGLTLPTVFLLGGVLMALAFPASNEFLASIYTTLFSTPLFAVYIFYFLCAYVIFAMIFLAIGAVSNSLQDAQSYMGPVTLLLFAPLPFVMLMYQNPNGMIASILTWIPLYTPFAVLLRVAADPPLWEIIGATVLMLIFAWALSRAMGRIFRRAILQSAPMKARDLPKLLFGREG